jgi:hypothetical protein
MSKSDTSRGFETGTFDYGQFADDPAVTVAIASGRQVLFRSRVYVGGTAEAGSLEVPEPIARQWIDAGAASPERGKL